MRFTLFVLLLIFPTFIFAQKVSLLEGSLDALKGQKEIALDFTYLAVMVGTDTDEETFVARKKSDWNAKEAGKGDAFEKYWYDNRKMYYQPAFTFHFAKASGLSVTKTAPYTLILKTKGIEPGWHAGVVGKTPTIDGQAWIVSTAGPSNIIAIINFEKCSGDDVKGGDFEMGRRIQSAYYAAAVEIAKFMKKKL